MAVSLAIDVDFKELHDAVNRIVAADRTRCVGLTVIEDVSGIPNAVLHKVGGNPVLLCILIQLNDFHLLLRHNCACNYVRSIHENVGCPVYVLVLGQLAGARQQRFWQGVAELCADETLFDVLVGFECVPSVSVAAEAVVAQGVKISKPRADSDPIVRFEGKKKCDPTDFHAVYLDMLTEVISVSDRRAAVIAGAFPSMYRLLEAVDSGELSRLRVEEYGEDRNSSALDPLISETLSTEYVAASSTNETFEKLLNENNVLGCLMLPRVNMFGVKRLPIQRKIAVKVLRTPMVSLEERMLSERELFDKSPLFVCSTVSPLALPQTFYPFTVFAFHACLTHKTLPKNIWFILLLAMHTTDPLLSLRDAQLFGGFSVFAQQCIQRSLKFTQTVVSSSSVIENDEDEKCLRLVALLMTSQIESAPVEVDEISKFNQPIRPYVLQLLLSAPLKPQVLNLVVKNELSKFKVQGIDHEIFNACARGLLANDHFFLPEHFQEMHELLIHLIDSIGSSFDYLLLQWASLLNKLSRIYMRQFQGESLSELHFRLLSVVPSLETKLPLTYLIRCIGSLMDTAVVKGDTGDYWEKIKTLATLTVRLYGSHTDALKSIWIVFFKAAVTIKPCFSLHSRVLEAYHICAVLGNPVRLDKSAFSQVVRFMVDAFRDNSIQDVSVTMDAFSVFLKEHLSINFLWVSDGVIAILSEIQSSHGMNASPVVRRFIGFLEDDYYPSVRATGVRLKDNPDMRRLLEDFQLVEKSAFWWQCGCGTKIPSSAKRCLTCLRRRNVSWTCGTCGSEDVSAGATNFCVCGAANPRYLSATHAGISLCPKCGDAVSSVDDCKACGHVSLVNSSNKQCNFCQKTYSRGSICCPACYEANEEKNPMLWRCDDCEEYNQTTWSKCQRCPGRRKVGCVVVPLKAWECGCGQRNHPCRLRCESCSQKQQKTYTCDSCGTNSFNKTTSDINVGSTILRVRNCETCGNIHPRDRIVLDSPFLPRHCHRCGSEYIRANLGSAACCTHCNASLSFNELNPFICPQCENKSPQSGFQCMFCSAPRKDLVSDDLFVWRCLQEEDDASNSELKTCGQWNYSWNKTCSSCGGSRAQSKYECRARFSPWVCRECQHSNLATDVLLCVKCDYGLQPACECFICGLTHISVDCCTDAIPIV